MSKRLAVMGIVMAIDNIHTAVIRDRRTIAGFYFNDMPEIICDLYRAGVDLTYGTELYDYFLKELSKTVGAAYAYTLCKNFDISQFNRNKGEE